MESLNLFAAAPEIALLACACFILLADLFIPDERRNLTYGLTMAALVLVAGICWFFFANDLVQYAFGGMYVTDPMASVLKIFSALCVGTMLVYAQGYARDRGIWKGELFALAVGSLVIGNLTAVAQTNLKRMLAYSTIAQMGFMLLAMLSGVVGGSTMSTANAYSAAMFYVITYALTTLGTFGIILLLARQGFEAEEISDLRGLNKRSPWFAFVMLLMMFSLAGIPPTMGFYAKLVVLQALLGNGITTGMVWLAIIAIGFSLIGAYYYLRVVKTMYFDEPSDLRPLVAAPDMRIALSANGLAVIALGIVPQYLLALCANAMIKTLGG